MLKVIIIDTDIPYVGKRKGNDLISVRWICNNLLITSHRCIETYFAGGTTLRPKAATPIHRSIGKHQGTCRGIRLLIHIQQVSFGRSSDRH